MTLIDFDGPGQWKAGIQSDDFNRIFTMAVWRVSERDPFPDMALTAQAVAASQIEPLPRFIDMRRQEGRRMLQAIVDAAWEAGIKPAGMEDHIRETAAMRRHLEDMRALTFAKSGTIKP